MQSRQTLLSKLRHISSTYTSFSLNEISTRPVQVLLTGILATSLCAQVSADEKLTVGYIEKAMVMPGEILFNAKLDTGARNSSIDAENIEEFEMDGDEWVRFDIVDRDGRRITMELPLVREAVIKRHFGRKQYRPIVELGICIGNIQKMVEVSLVDREGFLYKMLVGRSYLKKSFLIDPAESFTISPSCETNRQANE